MSSGDTLKTNGIALQRVRDLCQQLDLRLRRSLRPPELGLGRTALISHRQVNCTGLDSHVGPFGEIVLDELVTDVKSRTK